MIPELYLADLEAKPAALAALAGALETGDPFAGIPSGIRRVLLLGMGSSRYAARVAALRLRAAGVDAVAEYASAALSYPPGPETLVVAISATGGSRETLDAVARHRGRSFVLALTNNPDSAVTEGADLVVPMVAGEERGGVSCRTFQHTLALLLALGDRLTTPGREVPALAGATSGPVGGEPGGFGRDVPELLRRTAEATADLLDRRGEWLEPAAALLDGPHGVYTIAPAEHLSSAEQSALMFREGPRRAADACETGDWAHVDVYLTKTLDYRAILFPGSRYDEQAMDWIRQRGSTVLTVGGDLPGARASVRYLHDDDPDVALLTETLVAELVAARWWLA
ncbi:SIS domain-containing protein [Streptosporangium sp. NBC_01495]|uniref:SIS domain-containing protein n=1 Tax=Streptosporangium sp. NBC_01495 TaxID=2903899 RepID=UPI002E3289B4|nr:SIS domain-containing protein [Streptosporangium sp. NBC_01495]